MPNFVMREFAAAMVQAVRNDYECFTKKPMEKAIQVCNSWVVIDARIHAPCKEVGMKQCRKLISFQIIMNYTYGSFDCSNKQKGNNHDFSNLLVCISVR